GVPADVDHARPVVRAGAGQPWVGVVGVSVDQGQTLVGQSPLSVAVGLVASALAPVGEVRQQDLVAVELAAGGGLDGGEEVQARALVLEGVSVHGMYGVVVSCDQV